MEIIIKPSSVWIGKNQYPKNSKTIAMAKAVAKEKGILVYDSFKGKYFSPKKTVKKRTSSPFGVRIKMPSFRL